jgi:hypothetical protein
MTANDQNLYYITRRERREESQHRKCRERGKTVKRQRGGEEEP